MKMFSITKAITNQEGLIVKLSWKYSNSDGQVSGTHALIIPEEDSSLLPLEDVTETIAVGWLKDQLSNTEAEFEANIAEQKSKKDSEELLVGYILTNEGPVAS